MYTLSVLNAATLLVVHSLSLTSKMDIPQLRKYFNKKRIVEDLVFNTEIIPELTQLQPIVTGYTESNACLSIQHIQIDDVDTLLCGFGNGKILQLQYFINSASVKTALELAQEAVSCANADELGLQSNSVDSTFFDAQIYFVGTTLPILTKLDDSNAVICECDKPVVFY